MRKVFAVTALACALLMSCVSTATTVLNPTAKRPPITPDKVVIYTSKDKVPREFEEVAILTSQGDYTVAGDDKFYESFRKEAAKIGANGVIITPIDDPTTGQKVGSAILGAFLIPNTMGNRKTQATAIYVFPTPPTPEQAAVIAAFQSAVRTGMTRSAMIEAVGQPTQSTTSVGAAGESTETATYTRPAATTFVVILKNGVVSSVVRQ